MSEPSLPPHVVAFIEAHIHAVEQLRALLLLRETAPKAWTASELCAALRTSQESAAARLADLAQRGLLSVAADAYTYSGVEDATLADVSRLLESHRVAMIQLIYSKPVLTRG